MTPYSQSYKNKRPNLWNKKSHYQFMSNGSEISIANEYKYVGTVVSTKTKDIFGKNQDHLAHKSRNAIYAKKFIC